MFVHSSTIDSCGFVWSQSGSQTTYNPHTLPPSPSPGVYSSVSSSAGSGSPRPQTLQHPILSAVRAAWIPEDCRLWFRQTAQSREWVAHDPLLYCKLCRSRGVCVRASKNMSLTCIAQGLEDTSSILRPSVLLTDGLGMRLWQQWVDTEVHKSSDTRETTCARECVCVPMPATLPIPYLVILYSNKIKQDALPPPPSYPLTRYQLMIFASYSSGIEETGLWRCNRYLESRCTPLHHASRVGAAAVCTITQHEQRQCSV